MAGSDRSKWIGLCRQALLHLLLVQHWERASEADLRGWQAEIVAFREQMAAAVKGGRGMHGKFEKMFSKAWPQARHQAIQRLVEYSARPGDRRAAKRYRGTFDERVPDECPYLLEHVAGYDPRRVRLTGRVVSRAELLMQAGWHWCRYALERAHSRARQAMLAGAAAK